MKYAIQFYQGCKVLKDAEEIIIKYTVYNSNLIDFATNKINKNQRLIINVTKYRDKENPFDRNLPIFEVVKMKHPNFAILTSIEDPNIESYKDKNIDFFFQDFADNLDDLEFQVKLGVSDIYITNSLGFSLKDISNFLKEKNIQIRVFPNIAQSKYPENTDITKFFIRPEDVKIYEPYVDVFEFFGDNLTKQVPLMSIYKKEMWLSDLSLLILNFDSNINNSSLYESFGEYRLNCKKKCAYGRCHLCYRLLDFGNFLEDYMLEGEDVYEEDGGEIKEDF